MRWVRGLASAGVVFFIIFCYTIPVGFIASLANLEELSQTKGLTWLKPLADWNPKFTAFLQGFVPPLVLSIFISLVPTFMVILSRMECLPSESDAQASAIWVRVVGGTGLRGSNRGECVRALAFGFLWLVD